MHRVRAAECSPGQARAGARVGVLPLFAVKVIVTSYCCACEAEKQDQLVAEHFAFLVGTTLSRYTMRSCSASQRTFLPWK